MTSASSYSAAGRALSRLVPPLRLEPSPTDEMALLSLGRVRAENRFLFHAALWAGLFGYLLFINLLTDPLPLWSLRPLSIWGSIVLFDGFLVFVPGRRKYEARHRRLRQALQEATRARGDEAVGELDVLRGELISSVEEAEAALRQSDPETAADVARGRSHALTVIAWLDEAERLLARGRDDRELRQEVVVALSRPTGTSERDALRALLGQLDVQDLNLAALEREVTRRRSLLESFFLAIESASLAEGSEHILAAVGDPIRERVTLLAEVAAARDSEAAPLATGIPAARIRREVDLARDLQQSILPRRAPQLAGLTVAHRYRPSSEVGGDFYDFYATGENRLLVAVGDASGHGLDSSMVSSMAKSALYTQVSAGRPLGEAMAELNRLMCDTLGRRRLMTLLLMEVDSARQTASWVSAGQVWPLLRRAGEVEELEQAGYPLGVRRETRYQVRETRFEPGDLLLLLTDGYPEAADRDDEPYGWQQLAERLVTLGDSDPKSVIRTLEEDLSRHLAGSAPQDDVTLVAIRFER